MDFHYDIFIGVASFIFVPIICFYFAKKNDQRNYSWKDISWVIAFSYLWSFLNIFIHECGHALTGRIFGYVANEMSVGVGGNLFSLGGGEYTEINFQIFPVSGHTTFHEIGSSSQEIIILAMGVITQFLFLGLIWWLLKKNKNWQETLIGHFTNHYAIKIAFWLTFVLNFPFVLSDSDWTQIFKILFN